MNVSFKPVGGRYLRVFYMLFQVAEANKLEYWESDDYEKNEEHF